MEKMSRSEYWISNRFLGSVFLKFQFLSYTYMLEVVLPVNYIRLRWKPELDDKVAIRNEFSTTSMLISITESVEYQIEGSQSFTLVIIYEGVYPLIYRDREYSCSKNFMINIGLGSSCIQMMQATNLRDSNNFTFRHWLDLSWIRRILYQWEVSSCVKIIIAIRSKNYV